MRTVRCACSGLITADPVDKIDVSAAVQRHRMTAQHVRWAVVEFPIDPAPRSAAQPADGDPSRDVSEARAELPAAGQNTEPALFRAYGIR